MNISKPYFNAAILISVLSKLFIKLLLFFPSLNSYIIIHKEAELPPFYRSCVYFKSITKCIKGSIDDIKLYSKRSVIVNILQLNSS